MCGLVVEALQTSLKDVVGESACLDVLQCLRLLLNPTQDALGHVASSPPQQRAVRELIHEEFTACGGVIALVDLFRSPKSSARVCLAALRTLHSHVLSHSQARGYLTEQIGFVSLAQSLKESSIDLTTDVFDALFDIATLPGATASPAPVASRKQDNTQSPSSSASAASRARLADSRPLLQAPLPLSW